MATVRSRGPEKTPHMAEHLALTCASALFAGLTERDCMEIAACAQARTFARDELLFAQGQPVRSVILLQSGSVKKMAARLALTPLRLVKRIGTHTSEGIQISLSREEMAQMTGTTLFTISRILSK